VWFVVLCDQRGQPVPLLNEDEQLATFTDEDGACAAAAANILGAACGFRTYWWSG
jgi:hypothetical protein